MTEAQENARHLRGRVAVVTGGAHGIGLAICHRLAAEQAHLLIADIDPKIGGTVDELAQGYAVECEGYEGDLSTKACAEEMIQKAISRWGHVDIVINNAGGGVIRPFLQHTPQTLKTTIDRNLWTTIWSCWAVLPHMVERNYGRVINIGADSVRTGLFDHAAYNAAKGGVHAMTTGLAREFARYNITINTVAPSAVDTPGLQNFNPKEIDRFISVIPKGRPAKMEEVADLVCFLSLEKTAFITGQVISINGGSAML